MLTPPTAGGKWLNKLVPIDGQYRAFPTQNPIHLANGRLLVPVTLIEQATWFRASVLISDDEGGTFALSKGTIMPGNNRSQWEATVWEPTFQPQSNARTATDAITDAVAVIDRDGDADVDADADIDADADVDDADSDADTGPGKNSSTVYMFDRFNSGGNTSSGGPAPYQRLQHAKSTDGGFTWTLLTPVHVDTIVSRSLVTPLTPPLFMMVQNDWANGTDFSFERKNAWCAFSDRNLHSRMPLASSEQACDQWHSSRVSTVLTSSHCKLRPNTKGSVMVQPWWGNQFRSRAGICFG
jgi:hypothetical protein